MKRIIAIIERIEYLLMALGLLISIGILFLQIILRYIFNASLPWIEEAARYLFIYFTWIGTSIAVSSDQHIRFEALSQKFPSLNKYMEIPRNFICGSVSLFMLVYGIRLIHIMLRNVALSPTMKIPMWLCYAIIPITGTFMTCKYCLKIFDNIKST